jgi:predicted HTH transcriptional regulator
MTVPIWADTPLSNELSMLRSQGESQQLEFKEAFPAQGHELGKDIAALATAGGGRILLGVADDGRLVGLPAADGSARDAHMRRAQGIVGQVRPLVSATYLFAEESGNFVLCIQIPKQTEPVFYSDFRPIVRDGTISRPATPTEVQNLVWSHPSSEHKRFIEEMKRQQMRQIAEQGQRFIEETNDFNMRRNRAAFPRQAP